MTILGACLVVLGLPPALNVWKLADRAAALLRDLPWWLKGVVMDDPIGTRLLGAVAVVIGIGLVVGGIANRQVLPG